ncbi:deoxyribose-phosphate aldolase [Anaerorhabdus furcosa]|uniref:Deoxyribose-phosphate aldolase n=1 Tax=Anaerorhabdus furcosa TaxID=118967 RepID=A0A1T4N6Q2_9FIRM|nr:deoxyribose-phosphate aldolase [Anaerorhabdus furcosa]SJZ75000.1 deoxyribose-phosphate aldolase [Anaerorhabdus furcosa]
MKLNKTIDHTLLKQNSTEAQLIQLCKEAKEFDFATVCVNPCWIELCKKELEGTDVGVCTVIGFPLGAMTSASKVFEAKNAIEMGADEVDMVLNIGALKDNKMDYVINEIKAIKEAVGTHCLKVIIETCLLTDEEKVRACKAVVEAGADFVKTSTGFSTSGATIEDVKLMKETVKNACKVKAAGGVRSHDDLLKMIEVGADRIGTSSGVSLLQGEKVQNNTY